MADVAHPLRTIREVDPRGINVPTHSPRGQPLHAIQLSIPHSPVNLENGSFEYDRIIKQGELSKRTRKTKSWKPVFLILRPNVLSIYTDPQETKLRHRILLSTLTAVARQTDPKRKQKHIFALFSPSRNYYLEAASDREAHDWVEVIRREARMDEDEEEMMLASPGGHHTSPYQGFERSIDAQIGPGATEERGGGAGARSSAAGYASSSDADVGLTPSSALPRIRTRDSTTNATLTARHASYADYSGADRTSMSSFSDSGGHSATARLSALSLAHTLDPPRPSTSSAQPPPLATIYGTSAPARPNLGTRNASQMSIAAHLSPTDIARAQNPAAEEGVLHNCWTYLLKSKSGVRQWKKVWLVIRPKGLALYKNEEEYSALLVLALDNVIDAVQIDPVSRTKQHCMQIITEERRYKFCAVDEEGLAGCLGALKGLIGLKKARLKEARKSSVSGGGGAGL